MSKPMDRDRGYEILAAIGRWVDGKPMQADAGKALGYKPEFFRRRGIDRAFWSAELLGDFVKLAGPALTRSLAPEQEAWFPRLDPPFRDEFDRKPNPKGKRMPKKPKAKRKGSKKPRSGAQIAATAKMIRANKGKKHTKAKTIAGYKRKAKVKAHVRRVNPLIGVLTGNPRPTKKAVSALVAQEARRLLARERITFKGDASENDRLIHLRAAAEASRNAKRASGAVRAFWRKVSAALSARKKNPKKPKAKAKKPRTGKQIAATARMIAANRGKKHTKAKTIPAYKRKATVKKHERRVNPKGLGKKIRWRDLTAAQQSAPGAREAAQFAAKLNGIPLADVIGEVCDAPAGTAKHLAVVGELEQLSYRAQPKSAHARTKAGVPIIWDHKAGDHGRGKKKTKPCLVARDMRTGKPILVSRRGSRAGVHSKKGLTG